MIAMARAAIKSKSSFIHLFFFFLNVTNTAYMIEHHCYIYRGRQKKKKYKNYFFQERLGS